MLKPAFDTVNKSRPIPSEPDDPRGRPSSDYESASELPRGGRVLVAEDEYFAALMLEAALTDAGIDVVGLAHTAADAVQLARLQRPDLVVMDIRLRGRRDGVEAALEIFEATGIRCIFATAHSDPLTKARAQVAEPIGWVAKPYLTRALVAVVRSALREISD